MLILSIILCVATLFFGSLPFGVIIGKLWKGVDIRDYGSGNIGAANVYRTLGAGPAIVVLISDILKGVIPVLVTKMLLASYSHGAIVVACVGLLAIVGHNYSVFLKFKGGKGIATSCGVILALDWRIGLLGLGIWAVVVLLTKITSVASLVAIVIGPILIILFKLPVAYFVLGIILSLSGIYSHRENIKRLLKGEELRIDQKIKDLKESTTNNKTETKVSS